MAPPNKAYTALRPAKRRGKYTLSPAATPQPYSGDTRSYTGRVIVAPQKDPFNPKFTTK